MDALDQPTDVAIDERPGAPHHPPTTELWDQAASGFRTWRDGDPSGLDQLVRVMTPVLWHVVRAYGLDRETAQDVVQGTWATFLRRAHAIENPQAVAAWLTTTARRDAWRAGRGRTRDTVVEPETLELLVDDVAHSAEDEVVTTDGHDRLWACVRRLPERCRRLLRVVAFEDRPDYAVLSQDLGMPVGSSGPTRGRCLARLRRALAEEGEVR